MGRRRRGRRAVGAPEPGPLVRRIPRLTHLIYLPGMVLLVPTALGYYLYARDQTLALGFARAVPPFAEWVARTLPILYVVGGLAALVVNYRHASRPARRKLRVVVAGTLVGFGPLLCIAIWGYITNFTRFSEPLITLWFASFLALLLVPLSFAYAIVRHQVIPIRLIVRQGIRYLLVAKGFFLIEALVLLAALGFLLSGGRAAFLDRLGERADIAATVLVSVLVIGLLTLLHRRVMPSIDRRFFREEYDAQTVLAGLGEAVRQARTIDELLDIAAERVERALHPESMGVFLLDQATGNYSCVIPREGGAAVLRADSILVQELCCSPAPLLMSIVQASLRSQARGADMALTELVASMNRLLYRSTARNSFASFFYARFDAGVGRLTYVNAGHNPPLLVRGNGGALLSSGRRALAQAGGPAVQQAAIAEHDVVELLKAGGIVLGATEHATYEQESLHFAADDVLVAYTDGVTEAWSPEGEEFGEDRLRDVVVGARDLPAREIADRVVNAVREWFREAPQADDLTLVVAKCASRAPAVPGTPGRAPA